jgi:hypothetical protein
MSDETQTYNLAAIRELLRAAFDAESLRRFCHDRPDFRPILDDLGPDASLNQIIDQLLPYCEQRGLFRQLLAEVREVNPDQHARFAPRLHARAGRRKSLSPWRQTESVSPPPNVLDLVGRVADIAGVVALVYVLMDWIGSGARLTRRDLISFTALVGLVAVLYLGGRLAWEIRRFVLAGRERARPFFGRRYREHLVHRHRFFDVKGLSTQGSYTLELARVFVELAIAPRPVHEASADPIQALPPEARAGQTIWEYLNFKALNNQDLVVIGPPGCGKTTMLKHMVLTLVAGSKQRRQRHAPNKLPILLFLRDHAEAIQAEPDLSLAQAVGDSLARWDLHAPTGWFEKRLARGQCLVLLDGLDEVADPEARRQVVAWVQRQMEACGRNRFIVTSRPYGYQQHRLEGVTVLQISPFTRDQVERFVHNWYTANEIMSAQRDDVGVRQDAAQGANDLLRRLRNTPDLADLAVNPLLLTMIATVHRYRSSLPGRRVELYAEICQVFLGQRRQARGLELDLTPAQKQRVLQPLAYHLMCRQQREAPLAEALDVIAEPLAHVSPDIPRQQFLKKVEDESGLLLERESGVYGFAHKTFQEYLASAHALDQNMEDELVDFVGEDWWHETLRLYAAQTDASPLVAACLAGEPPSIPALILAIECREEALELAPTLRAQLEKVLTEGVEDADPDRWRAVAEALLGLRLRHMVRVDEDRYLDNSLVTHAEYQLFLDEKRAQGAYYQPDHWTDLQFPQGQGRAPVVGIRPSDAAAFCEWLTGREAGEWHYRLPQTGESRTSLMEQTEIAAFWVQTAQGFECSPTNGCNDTLEEQLGRQLDHDVGGARARLLEIACGRAGALALDLDRKLDRAFVLGLQQALTIARTRDLDLARERTIGRTLERARALDRVIQRTRVFARELTEALTPHITEVPSYDQVRALADALALAEALALDLVVDLDRAHDFDRALALALDRLPGLKDLNRTHAIGRARALAHELNRHLDRVRALDFELDFELDLTLDRCLALARNRALDCNVDLDLDFNFPHYIDLARDLDHIVDRACDRTLTSRSQPEDNEALRQQVRSNALILSAALRSHLATQSRPWTLRLQSNRERGAVESRIQHLANAYLDLYVKFFIQEARIAGELPAFEGLRLVRERQPLAGERSP